MGWLAEQYGNIASVIGLMISLATLMVAASTRAKLRAAERKVLQRTKSIFYHGMIEECLQALRDCRTYCSPLNLVLAIDRCRRARELIREIREVDILAPADAMSLARIADDLNVIMDKLSRKRTQAADLMVHLDRQLEHVAGIRHRLFRLLLEQDDE